MLTKLPVMAVLGATLLLAGCKQHQAPPEENQTAVEAPKPVVAAKPKPAPAEKPKPAAPKPKPLPATPEEQQVLDDADATGMTARVDRSGDTGAAPSADTNREQ